jgi:hypothetical protein
LNALPTAICCPESFRAAVGAGCSFCCELKANPLFSSFKSNIQRKYCLSKMSPGKKCLNPCPDGWEMTNVLQTFDSRLAATS